MLAPAPHYAVMWGSWGPEGTWTTVAGLRVTRFWDRLSFRMFRKETSEEGRLERCSHERLERLVNDVLRSKTSVCCVFEQQCSNMRSDFKQLRKLRGIFLHLKKIARSHRHASTAGMGMLARTAIGINKTTRHGKQRRQGRQRKARKAKRTEWKRHKNTIKRLKIMVF